MARWLILLVIMAAVFWWNDNRDKTDARVAGADVTERVAANPSTAAFLPAEAQQTIRLIQQGGPFPHTQDGTTFFNREGRLPQHARGYYREYTVKTPGLNHRGARRIVTGGQPPDVWYYTDDHYDSFRPFTVAP